MTQTNIFSLFLLAIRMIKTAFMSWTLTMRCHSGQASQELRAKKVVNVIQPTHRAKTTVVAFKGMRFGSEVTARPSRVAAAIACENGSEYANPHVKRWGFM